MEIKDLCRFICDKAVLPTPDRVEFEEGMAVLYHKDAPMMMMPEKTFNELAEYYRGTAD